MVPRLHTLDYHCHTSRSRCCDPAADLATVLGRYAEAGFTHLGLCDHYYSDLGAAPFRETRLELERCGTSLDVRVSVECELAGPPGLLLCDDLPELLSAVDHLSVAPHCHSLSAAVPAHTDALSFFHRMHLGACEHPDVAVILHPWDCSREQLDSLEDLPDGFLRELAECAAATGTALEISNCFTHDWVWRSPGLRASYELLVRELLRAGAPIVIGTDGHNLLPTQYGEQTIPATHLDTAWPAALLRRLGADDTTIRLPKRRGA